MKYRLDVQHFFQNQLLEEGTEIGDGTMYPLYDGFAPSAAMTPLDDEAANRSREWGSQRPNWGRPEENLPTKIGVGGATDHPIVGTTINRSNQPIIPPPIEHLTRPNDMKPTELGPRQNPLITEALQKQNEEMASANDKRMAEEANRAADLKSKANLPHGVTTSNTGADARTFRETAPGQGPAPKTATMQNIPGQGPGVFEHGKPGKK